MFRFINFRRRAVLITLGAAVLLAGAGVGAYLIVRDQGKTVTIAGDQMGCVYTSAAKGHHFVKSIAPGASAHVSKTDELVLLPNGDQIYTIGTVANRTPEAPDRLLAFTSGQTAVWVEGVLKFRFNTSGSKACQWYSKYGLQSTSYGNLGFAATSGIQQEKTGWYRFLAEAHGTTLQQVVHDGSSAWTWQQLAYGADPTLKIEPTTEPVSVGYGKHIGSMFTKYLNLNLGSNYFCGVQAGITGPGASPGCPPMYFQITSVYPRDKTLAEEHDKLKQLDAQLARQRQAAKLRDLNRNTLIKEALAQRKVIQEQIVNARLAAQNDVHTQRCLILARVGLDCDGKKPNIIVPGVTTK